MDSFLASQGIEQKGNLHLKFLNDHPTSNALIWYLDQQYYNDIVYGVEQREETPAGVVAEFAIWYEDGCTEDAPRVYLMGTPVVHPPLRTYTLSTALAKNVVRVTPGTSALHPMYTRDVHRVYKG